MFGVPFSSSWAACRYMIGDVFWTSLLLVTSFAQTRLSDGPLQEAHKGTWHKNLRCRELLPIGPVWARHDFALDQ